MNFVNNVVTLLKSFGKKLQIDEGCKVAFKEYVSRVSMQTLQELMKIIKKLDP